MYFFLGAILITSSIAWHLAMEATFFISVMVAIAIIAYIHAYRVYNDTFLRQAIHCMGKPDCCCIHKIWSVPASILSVSVFLKVVAGILAVVAVIVTWLRDTSFIHHHYFVTEGVWTIASIAWILSTAPFIISLIQCAAEDAAAEPMPVNIAGQPLHPSSRVQVDGKTVALETGQNIIIRFRKSIAIWLIHDIVIGIFWLYLSILLYDLTDDNDDSNWRTVFLSMISWHIVFAVLHSMYIKKWWSVVHIQKEKKRSKACCAPSEADKWWTIVHLIGMVFIYIGVIQRMNEPKLMDMGCRLQTLILFIGGAAAFCGGKHMTRNVLTECVLIRPHTGKQASFIKKNTYLDF